jgi:hypothetical protein
MFFDMGRAARAKGAAEPRGAIVLRTGTAGEQGAEESTSADPYQGPERRRARLGDGTPAASEDEQARDQGHIRQADVLRARFLPEVESLDFSGLFVGNLGSEVLERRRGRGVTQAADPSRITDLLLRGNGCRRRGAHAEALLCYQELVALDPANPDFRFLLNTTYQAMQTESAPSSGK